MESNKNFGSEFMIAANTLFETEYSYDDSKIIVFGAPFDSTTSYRPGTRFASRTMRAESYGLEYYSPGQDFELTDVPFFDAGDLNLSFGDTKQTLNIIENYTAEVIADNKFPLMIGGEHLLTLAPVSVAFKKYSDLALIHFDAHADLRDEYLGVKLSHASVVRRIYDLLGDDSIFQFGIRSGDKAEFDFAKIHTHLQLFDFSGLEEVIKKLKGRPVYFTLDLDVLDPSCFPGTGTPEAGGVTFIELMKAAFKVFDGCEVVGFDMMELSPPYDPSGISTATALKLLREFLIRINSNLARR